MNIQTLNEVESEVYRFLDRLARVKALGTRMENKSPENGALKRAAADLKKELNKITGRN
jgi:hypothetical protein